MDRETIAMSHKELDRVGVIRKVVDGVLVQREAALQLGLSVRQVKRLVRAFRAEGPKGLVSRHRGRPSNNRIDASLRDHFIELVRTYYHDFGPTLAHEKLTEQHGFSYSVETLRAWMIAEGLWQPRRRHQASIHQRRPRRPCRGELVQIDGSPHAWFEDRGPECCLIVFIDDATSELGALRFVPTETTQAYMETLEDYLLAHGRPVALYSDCHSIFRVNNPDREGELTQFSRALKTLDIGAIHANTPQAKGRVERANQTLQDRLVKELRLRGISDIDAANAFLPEFIADYNRRFAKPPQCPTDAHRPILHDASELALIFSIHHPRKLSKNLTCQFQNREYQITGKGKGYRLRGSPVTLCEGFDGSLTILSNGQPLSVSAYELTPFPTLLRSLS
jgi:transposase